MGEQGENKSSRDKRRAKQGNKQKMKAMVITFTCSKDICIYYSAGCVQVQRKNGLILQDKSLYTMHY